MTSVLSKIELTIKIEILFYSTPHISGEFSDTIDLHFPI